jgi:hypothetical protein
MGIFKGVDWGWRESTTERYETSLTLYSPETRSQVWPGSIRRPGFDGIALGFDWGVGSSRAISRVAVSSSQVPSGRP